MNYFLHLLPGTEMDEAEYRKNFLNKLDLDFMIILTEFTRGKNFEAQETILKTNTN